MLLVGKEKTYGVVDKTNKKYQEESICALSELV